jgi:hypothetical protein
MYTFLATFWLSASQVYSIMFVRYVANEDADHVFHAPERRLAFLDEHRQNKNRSPLGE